ncbi:MAG: hypothetical protein ACKVP0_08370 [Pirellulaceae bacterium]
MQVQLAPVSSNPDTFTAGGIDPPLATIACRRGALIITANGMIGPAEVMFVVNPGMD